MSSAAHDLSPVVQTVDIAAPPERVFQLFVDPEQLVRWWPDAARLDPRLGARVELVHSGWEAVPTELLGEWRALHGAGWTFFLSCLRDLAEGRAVDKNWG